MPEIPSYQSRGTPPATTGAGPANPSIVGGEEIVQGANNLASGLASYAFYQRQQVRADQIAQAGQVFNVVKQALDTKERELVDRQATTPINPRLIGKEYNEYATKIVNDTLADPALQAEPFMHKYLSTHLPTALSSTVNAFNAYTDKAWQNWDQFNTSTILEDFRQSALKDPEQESQFITQARAFLAGRVANLSMTGEQADAAFTKLKAGVNYGRGVLFAKSNATNWVNATRAGKYPTGFDATKYTPDELKEFDTQARETFSATVAEIKQADDAEKHTMESVHAAAENDWLSRHLPHQDQGGKMLPGESTDNILARLGTAEAKATLGPKWPAVHSFYTSLQHQERTGGVKPSAADYNKVLKGIYTGRLTTSMAVLKEAAGLKFDIASTNEVLGKFETERGHIDTTNQERIRQGLQTIAGKFELPGGAALDPADAIGRKNMVETRFYLWLEELKKQGPSSLTQADIIGTAQKIADQEYANMAAHVINIIPRTEASLIYKTPAEVQAAFKAGDISKHQADSYLQEIATFERLQRITETKKSSAAPGKAFK